MDNFRKHKDWKKIDNFNYYYIGSWPNEGEYVGKHFFVKITPKIYSGIKDASRLCNKVIARLEDGRIIDLPALCLGLFDDEIEKWKK